VPYFAAALARRPSGWSGEEIDLKGVEDLDAVIEELRRVGEDADTLLLFVEENDEWFAVVRIDEDGDPRVFLSDGRAMETSELGAILGEAAAIADPVEEPLADEDAEAAADDEEDEVTQVAGDPVGDAELLADLGTPAPRLLELCAEEGQLPADIMSSLCESAGCLEMLDSLRMA
jgi:putative tRNA adenosine deaminase-associated protein